MKKENARIVKAITIIFTTKKSAEVKIPLNDDAYPTTSQINSPKN